MKLSANTVEVLKNFATINPGLIFRPGHVLKTVASGKSIFAEAHIDEEFDREFGIYDLNKTLGLLSMNTVNKTAPEITIEPTYLTVSGIGQVRQRFTNKKMIFGHDLIDKKLIEPNDIKAHLSQESFVWITSAAAVLRCPHIVFRNSADSTCIEVCALDAKGEIEDDARISILGQSTSPFQAVIKIESLKIIPGDYDIAISKSGIVKFTNTKRKLTYWLPVEENSSKFE